MMIVARANLYSGRAEEVRKRRPWLIAAIAGVLLVITLFVADIGRYRTVRTLRETVGATQRLEAQLQQKLESARTRDAELSARIAKRDALLAYGAERRNWAHVLETIFAAIPSGVELTKVEIGEVARKATIRIEGKCVGVQPRLEADKCLLQMTHALATAGVPMEGTFSRLEDATSSRKNFVAQTGVAEFVIQFTDGGRGGEI